MMAPPTAANVTPSQPLSDNGLHQDLSVTPTSHVTDENQRKCLQTNTCDGVTASEVGAPAMGLQLMLHEMAEDIDDVAAAGGEMPYSGHDLRQHYDAIVEQHGLAAATADARDRYRHQAQCTRPDQLSPLTFPCACGSAVSRNRFTPPQ